MLDDDNRVAGINQFMENLEQLGDVVKVINSIAEQTNLLALNATIEANLLCKLTVPYFILIVWSTSTTTVAVTVKLCSAANIPDVKDVATFSK